MAVHYSILLIYNPVLPNAVYIFPTPVELTSPEFNMDSFNRKINDWYQTGKERHPHFLFHGIPGGITLSTILADWEPPMYHIEYVPNPINLPVNLSEIEVWTPEKSGGRRTKRKRTKRKKSRMFKKT